MSNITSSVLSFENAVSLYDVMKDDWILVKNNKYLAGVILTIKAADQGKGRLRAFSSRNLTVDSPYDRVLTIADLNNPDGTCFVLLYHSLHEASTKMSILREHDLGVGQKIAIIEPTYKKTFLAPLNDLPIITSKRNIELLPDYPLPTIPFLENGPAGKTIFFSYTNVKTLILDVTMETSHCTGIMCDRQIVKSHPDKSCSCFSKGKFSDVIMDSTVFVFPSTSIVDYESKSLKDNIFKDPIDNFRSWSFMKHFFVTMPEVTVTTAHFKGKTDFFREKLENAVQEVNDGSGWDLVGWSKRGTKKDEAQPQTIQHAEYDMIQSEKISPHICYLQPSPTETEPISINNKYQFQILTPTTPHVQTSRHSATIDFTQESHTTTTHIPFSPNRGTKRKSI